VQLSRLDLSLLAFESVSAKGVVVEQIINLRFRHLLDSEDPGSDVRESTRIITANYSLCKSFRLLSASSVPSGKEKR
jgi:hypothetical protein